MTDRLLRVRQPVTLAVGAEASSQCCRDLGARGLSRLLVITSPPVRPHVVPLLEALRAASVETLVFDEIETEPDVAVFEKARAAARSFRAEGVVGVGGGSALDVAKLAAALIDTDTPVAEVFGIDLLPPRSTFLACLPTTSGTGSEVSPNAILLDTEDALKKGVVSPYLVPDAAYVDPALTLTVPPAVTASTGLDALTHCIEEYANRFANPVIDVYALEGITRIGRSLERACRDGTDLAARTDLAIGSLFGGMGLGPVNTAAVHALAYPLGGRFHVPHGVSNAILLSHVLDFNLPAAPDRYARIATALGVESAGRAEETARRGVERIRALARACGITQRLRDFGVAESDLPEMATSALTVQRLLKNNPREVTLDDALAIYWGAW